MPGAFFPTRIFWLITSICARVLIYFPSEDHQLPNDDQPDLRCYYHPDREATSQCDRCGDYLCGECVKDLFGTPLCAKCLKHVRTPGLETMEEAERGMKTFMLVCGVLLVLIVGIIALGR